MPCNNKVVFLMIPWDTEKQEFLFFKATHSWLLRLGMSSFSSCSLTVCVLWWILHISVTSLRKYLQDLMLVPILSLQPPVPPADTDDIDRCHRHSVASHSALFPLHYSFCPPQNSAWAFSVFQWCDWRLGVNADFRCPQGPLCCPYLGGALTSAATAACGLNAGGHLRMLFQDTHFQRANFYVCF